MRDDLKSAKFDMSRGVDVIIQAIREPLKQIVINAGGEPGVVLNTVETNTSKSVGYNAATQQYGDMLEMGVVDPTKVTRCALQNAASVGALLLTTDCMIVEKLLEKQGPTNG
jgi:chaperonin GroEL